LRVKKSSLLLLVAASLGLGALLVTAIIRVANFEIFRRTAEDVESSVGQQILVMRTRGGLLEVSSINAVEIFDRRFIYSILGVRIGETVSRIRVPATYRYRIALAPEWRVLRTSDVFIVVAPPVEPSLPVAVDLSRMEKEVSGNWILAALTSTRDLEDLERGITAQLARKAVSPAYIRLQREHARRTVDEFVRKWLVTQVAWKLSERPRLEVLFADEPVRSIDTFIGREQKN
jgi:hypothetical protein